MPAGLGEPTRLNTGPWVLFPGAGSHILTGGVPRS